MTARIFRGEAETWSGLTRVWIGERGEAADRRYEVQSARAYRDRLVLKLAGIDDANRAEELRGGELRVSAEDAADLPRDEMPPDLLEGLAVIDETGRRLGVVGQVMSTGGVDLLVVRLDGTGKEDRDPEDALIPLAEEIVLEIDPEEGRIRVRLPEGLLELNRADPAV